MLQLYEDGFAAAENSKRAKNNHEYEEACELLKEAAQCFIEASALEKDLKKVELLRAKNVRFCARYFRPEDFSKRKGGRENFGERA